MRIANYFSRGSAGAFVPARVGSLAPLFIPPPNNRHRFMQISDNCPCEPSPTLPSAPPFVSSPRPRVFFQPNLHLLKIHWDALVRVGSVQAASFCATLAAAVFAMPFGRKSTPTSTKLVRGGGIPQKTCRPLGDDHRVVLTLISVSLSTNGVPTDLSSARPGVRISLRPAGAKDSRSRKSRVRGDSLVAERRARAASANRVRVRIRGPRSRRQPS